MFRRKNKTALQESLRPGEEMHSIHRALDVALRAPCSVMFTTERMAYALDARPQTILDLPYDRFHGIAVNWDKFYFAAEVRTEPLTVQGHSVPAATPSMFVGLEFTEPINRGLLDHALGFVSEKTGECPEHGQVVMDKVTAWVLAVRQ